MQINDDCEMYKKTCMNNQVRKVEVSSVQTVFILKEEKSFNIKVILKWAL